MQCRVQVSRQGRVLHEGEYMIEKDGDTERAVSDALRQARTVQPGPLWDVLIDVRKIELPSQP